MSRISFNGFNTNVMTISTKETLAQHTPVTVDNDSLCIAAPADADFIGVVVAQRGNIVTVQTDGYVELPYTGEDDPTMGYCGLVSDGEGGVKVTTGAAKQYKLLRVDDNAETVGFIL